MLYLNLLKEQHHKLFLKKLNQDNLLNLGSLILFLLNQFLDLNSLLIDTKNINDTPAAHKYCKLDLSSKRLGLTIENALGNLISD